MIYTIEAIIFGAGEPIKKSYILEKLPALNKKSLDKAISVLQEKYSGESGIHLLEFNDKLQFSTNPSYGEDVAEVLRPVKEKALSQSLLETLAIVAYKQPVTRPEIEDIRGVQSADYQISLLLRADLIEPVGRRDSVGRPVIYGTTDEFLKKFELSQLADLPDYSIILDKLRDSRNTMYTGESLYRDTTYVDEFGAPTAPEAIDNPLPAAAASILDELVSFDDLPDFLQGEEFERYEGADES